MEESAEDERQDAHNSINNGGMHPYDGGDDDDESQSEAVYEEAFYNELRGRRVSAEGREMLETASNALSSGTGEDGGYLIPTDQQTAIIELKRSMRALEHEVNVENVTTNTGTRNVEKDAEFTPMTEFTEGDDVPDGGSPQFMNISYAIKDRGAFLPVPNNLLNDNTANLKSYLNKWLAKKQVATRNSLIVTLLSTVLTVPTAIAGLDDVKDVVNVSLDPAISATSKAYTNQDGFNEMDQWKDTDGRPLLQPCPTDSTKKMIAGKVIEVYSNKTLKTTLGKAPIYIGSMKEFVTLFDRQAISVVSTNIGGEAFKKNRTDIRAISREDVKSVDSDALVYGEIVVS